MLVLMTVPETVAGPTVEEDDAAVADEEVTATDVAVTGELLVEEDELAPDKGP